MKNDKYSLRSILINYRTDTNNLNQTIESRLKTRMQWTTGIIAIT